LLENAKGLNETVAHDQQFAGLDEGGDDFLDDRGRFHDDCDTSLCVDAVCSGACTSDADCIPALPACYQVPAILGTGSYCLPAQ
jgi:hypothetical protein